MQILTGDPIADAAEEIYQALFGDADCADERFHIGKSDEIAEWLTEEDWLNEATMSETIQAFSEYDTPNNS